MFEMPFEFLIYSKKVTLEPVDFDMCNNFRKNIEICHILLMTRPCPFSLFFKKNSKTLTAMFAHFMPLVSFCTPENIKMSSF